MYCTSSWYLPHSASLQSGRRANICKHFSHTFRTHFDRIWFFFANFATNSYMYWKRTYWAPIWPQSIRFTANVFISNVSVDLFSRINCHLSLAWFQIEKCHSRSNLTRPNGVSKFQVLLHDFPSLRQQCRETCTFYCALQDQKAIPEGRAAPGTSMRQKQRHFVGEY